MLGRLARGAVRVLWPTQRLLWTREGVLYFAIWMVLLVLGLQQQINLILLVAGLAAGPVARRSSSARRCSRGWASPGGRPPYVFSGDPLRIDYTLENSRRWAAALALFIEDELVPVDRSVSGAAGLTARVFFNRVPGREKARVRWEGVGPKRGRYRFRTMELITRSPFGLLERRVTVSEPGGLIVYPAVGRLTRRWHLVHRQATETRRGRSHERSSQQQEYHGLRDYRPGDSPRWIHWRTTARVGVPMVKEFEQQSEQDLAVLLDPWLPRTKVTAEQRESLEQAVQFAATVCLETCRRSGRRLLLGWTGATPGLRQGPASVKLLHELLEQLAVVRGSAEGTLSALLDILPPSTLREASHGRGLDPAGQPGRGGRAVGAALGGVVARAARPGDAARRLAGRPRGVHQVRRDLVGRRARPPRPGDARPGRDDRPAVDPPGGRRWRPAGTGREAVP